MSVSLFIWMKRHFGCLGITRDAKVKIPARGLALRALSHEFLGSFEAVFSSPPYGIL